MRTALIIFAALMFIFIMSMVAYTCNQATEHVTDNAFVNYEEFQEIYNSCRKINEDLCVVEAVPETDKMFDQFSKQQRITAMRQNLNRWMEDYNAKSKMWNRALWKSKTLPYQLVAADFNCY